MTLTHLSDDALIERLKNLVHEEREILISVLHHLREVERRISAMRLLRDVPQKDAPRLEAKITSGHLSLTNLVLAQTLFSKEKKAGRQMNAEAKLAVLSQLENQSTRHAEKIVCGISPEMLARKKELHFNLIDDDSLREKLLRLKGHFAHAQPNMNLTDLLHRLCDEKLESFNKQKSPSAPRVNLKSRTAPVAAVPRAPSQAEIKRQVWWRDKGRCSNCRSTFALEIDHVLPRSVGGPSTIANTRLLCRVCN